MKRFCVPSSSECLLSVLVQVFTALRTGQLHVPYRNSKLTHLLQPSLGGDAKVTDAVGSLTPVSCLLAFASLRRIRV